MHIYSDESRENDERSLPDVEVFYADEDTIEIWNDERCNEYDAMAYTEGWYYWLCLPGCLPDSEPIGPFETEEEALDDAKENA